MELPRHLRDAQAHKEQPPGVARINGHHAAPEDAERYAASAFTKELAALAATTEPGRNEQLNVSAFSLAQLVATGALDRDRTWDALYSTATAIGLTPTETRNTLRSAFEAGGLHPRYVRDMELPPVAPPVTVLGVVGDHPNEHDEEEEEETPGDAIRRRFPPLDWQALWEDDEEEEWIVYPILPARRFVALFSPPKIGKSLLLLELAVAIARGQEALGAPVDRPRRVLYLDFENDPRGDVRTRLQAMGRKPDELDDLVYLSYPSLAYLDTFMGAAELLAICQEYGVEVVVIDTISRAVGGEENDNDTWLGLYRNTGVALKRAGIAAIRLDHTGKDQTKGMRGGSAKYGDVDAVWSMTALSDTTFRLECTANRLPIAEKVLTLERAQDPLRHVVSTDGVRRAMDQRRDTLLKTLRDLGWGNDPNDGVPMAIRLLRDAGLYPLRAGANAYGKNEVEDFVDRLKHPEKYAPEASTLQWKEDTE